jgi:hypothetical protein
MWQSPLTDREFTATKVPNPQTRFFAKISGLDCASHEMMMGGHRMDVKKSRRITMCAYPNPM